MTTTKIIATIGPACLSKKILTNFKENSVSIARLNFSHNTSQWHSDAGILAKECGLETMIDLGGPKIRLGEMCHELNLLTDWVICMEHQGADLEYPYDYKHNNLNNITIPCRFEIAKFVSTGKILLLDDGKITLEVTEVIGKKVFCKVIFGGIVKTAKSVNLPYSKVEVPFLTDRDKKMLKESISIIRPEYVACSFVKSIKDIETMREYIKYCLNFFDIRDYSPKICVKLETHEVLEDNILEEVISDCDLVMIARGDMALEILPAHILVPFYQNKIAKICHRINKPFVVATEALDSMITKPTPSRAEISDIYKSIAIDKADYIMLSGESATGNFPCEAVSLMNQMIEQYGDKS